MSHTCEAPAPELSLLNLRKESLHQIDPRRAGGSEVQVYVGMLEEPTLYTWCLVRRVVIQNQMNLLLGSAWHRDVEQV